ncbi:cobalt ECF transporter T component CbiQ [Methanotorris igneus]|uniref:Cobalt ABC transporter, inner membrane subunit CbiQ n=1 Tax=Methanotorris igneus (strain DSM 5666 / JCM 11834 / Kol 5) TaxID=880724 RepID=F6BD02_METIK|nr:cobalt ECF transporter T component CbiQ [Methanotorris igneus]AEF96363.1 cobalt ABC transporter, inner membrane subunit CbiQ [Methanotorris igneus Kol 5]
MQNIIDNIAHYNKLRMVNPKLKVIFAISSLLVCVFSKSIVVPIIVALIMIYLTLFRAGVPKSIYLKLMFAPIGFGLITLVLMAFMFGYVKLFSFEIFGFKIPIYKDGIDLGLLVFSRMLGGVACMLFLALTTPMTELFYVLRELGVPSSVLDIAMMMYRYIFVLLEEMIRVENAQKTRLGYRNLKTTFKSLGMLASNLFIRTWERGEQLFITMSSRCYNGDLKVFGKIENPKSIYIVGIILFEIFLVIISYLTMNFKPF